MAIQHSFDRAAAEYDSLRRKFIPGFDDYYGVAVDRIAAAGQEAFHALDLGAGTGLLSAFVLGRFPQARLTLIDVSEGMLAMARQRFAGQPIGQVVCRVADYATMPLLAPGEPPVDMIVSALSVHHLENADKQALFHRILTALRPGGLFVNADQVAGPTPELSALYDQVWVRQITAAGITPEQLAAARERQTHDRLAPLDDQLRWLGEAGFQQVDCLYKNWSFVVYAGVTPA